MIFLIGIGTTVTILGGLFWIGSWLTLFTAFEKHEVEHLKTYCIFTVVSTFILLCGIIAIVSYFQFK